MSVSRNALSRLPVRFAIRRMRPEDLGEVMAIEGECFPHPWSEELFRREMSHEWSSILVAETEDEQGRPSVIGFIIYWLVHDEIHILNVAAHPQWRRRGVARALLAEGVRNAKSGRGVLATLEARRSNAAALALYRTFGFRPVGVRPNYYSDDGEDAIVMVMNL
jgi:[ribosomal protein S18]-alanine N-acetyltransferase